MAIELLEGFDIGSAGPMPTTWNWDASSIATGGRGGGLALKNFNFSGSVTLTLPPSARKTFGQALYLDSGNAWGSALSTLAAFSSGATQHLTVTWDATGHIQVRLGSAAGTVLATSVQVWVLGAYHYAEVQATIADSGGTCVVRVDGVEWVNFTGDTRNGGATTTIDKITMLTRGAGGGDQAGIRYMDDVYVLNETDATATTGRPDNTFLGDVKVELLLPNGNGTSSQWVGSDGNSTDNYLLVDDNPPSTADYVASATAGQRDLWTLGNVGASTATVFAVSVGTHMQKTDAGAASVKTILRDAGGGEHLGAVVPLTTGWLTTFGALYAARPAGGAWTVADVNGLQLGVEQA